MVVCVSIWGHRIKWSYNGEGLQDMILHKGLRLDLTMIFPCKGRSSHFNRLLCQWFLPTPSFRGCAVGASMRAMVAENSSRERSSSPGRCGPLSAATRPPSSHRGGTDVSLHRLLRASGCVSAAAGNLLLRPRAAPLPAFPPPQRAEGALPSEVGPRHIPGM